MQQNIVSQIEALEIAMNLEASPIGDIGSGMMQISHNWRTLQCSSRILREERKVKNNYGAQDSKQTDTINTIAWRSWTMS